LIFFELFVAPEFQEISLNKWLRALPEQAAMAHTNLKKTDLDELLSCAAKRFLAW
jgi:oxalate decarboxylase